MRAEQTAWLVRWMRRLLWSSRGTMALTLSQMFMGALTIGIATFRGTEAYETFYYETQLGHANYGASKLSSSHARSANSVANNNVISTTIMGPRFAVEADNLTMLANAAIACPQSFNPKMAMICAQFKKNYPRMLAKLLWVRLKQKMLWGALGKLSDTIDKIASLDALEIAQSTISGMDADVQIRAEDPSSSGSIWGSDNTPSACMFASKDALVSPMPGAAFPILMPTLLAYLPKALTKIMPRMICGVIDDAIQSLHPNAGGMGKHSGVSLPEIPDISKAANEECDSLANMMRSQSRGDGDDDGPRSGKAALTQEVNNYVRCGALGPRSGGDDLAQSAARYAFRSGGQLTTCAFDMRKCQEEKLEEATEKYLVAQGLPKIASTANRAVNAVAQALGGATHAPSDGDWNHSDTMRTCAFTNKPVDETILRINDGVNTLVSFGTASDSRSLRRRREYQSCAKTYFPDAEGDFASTPHSEQPFVAAWKFALVGTRGARR